MSRGHLRDECGAAKVRGAVRSGTTGKEYEEMLSAVERTGMTESVQNGAIAEW